MGAPLIQSAPDPVVEPPGPLAGLSRILVVGGASGIGNATVARLLDGGYHVIVADRSRERLEALGREHALRHDRFSSLHIELTDPRVMHEALARIKEEFGTVDGLIISAGIHSTCPVEYLSDEAIHRVVDINLTAHIKLIRDALPILNDGSRIIGVSSIAAGLGVPMSSLYSASKAGLEAFYESLAIEVSYRRIRPIVIHPGTVNTGFNETGNEYRPTGNRFLDEGYRRVVSRIESRSGMDPDDVAAVIIMALQSRAPRFCYLVGSNAKKAYWAKRLLGREAALKLMARYFGFR